MSDTDPTIADRALARRRREDTAFVLPVFGVALTVSPVLNIFAGIETIAGIPSAFLYIYAVWVFLILATLRISRKLMQGETG